MKGRFTGQFPALLACLGVAVVAYPWGLLALVPVALVVGIEWWNRRDRP